MSRAEWAGIPVGLGGVGGMDSRWVSRGSEREDSPGWLQKKSRLQTKNLELDKTQASFATKHFPSFCFEAWAGFLI